MQQWHLTGYGQVKLLGSEKCLDVKAEKKKDGSRESWDEIKQHTAVNVQLYKCHNPHTTHRVNQIWGWVTYKNGKAVTEYWELGGTGLSGPAPVSYAGLASMALAAAGVCALSI